MHKPEAENHYYISKYTKIRQSIQQVGFGGLFGFFFLEFVLQN